MNRTRKLLSREAFMSLFVFSVGGIASVVFGIPIIGWVIGPLVNQPRNVWRFVGHASNFQPGKTVAVIFDYPGQLPWAGATKKTKAWLRRDAGNGFTAFAVYCTHLGCPVQWLQTPQLFLCPCHGSVFYGDGTVAGGPAPRPLFQYPTRVLNGKVYVLAEPVPLTT
jgi:menaquinol-cytochrome c reductase iron-sulfur subunit